MKWEGTQEFRRQEKPYGQQYVGKHGNIQPVRPSSKQHRAQYAQQMHFRDTKAKQYGMYTEGNDPCPETSPSLVRGYPSSNSHGRLPFMQQESERQFGIQTKNERSVGASSKKLESSSSTAGLNEYRHLHEKLNTLQNKILTMRTNLQKKKEDKKRFLEAQIRERKERQRMVREENDRKEELRQKQERHEQRHRQELRMREERQDRENRMQEKPKKQTQSPLKSFITQVPQHKELRYFDFNPYSPRNNTYYVSEVLKAYKEEKSVVRQHLVYSMHMLKQLENSKRPTMFEVAAKNVNLPKKDMFKDKKTIVFDLDETLIHCNQNVNQPHDMKISIRFPNGEIVEAGINIRPYAQEILRNLSRNFEIIVFTASHSCYANVVLDKLDPDGKYIQHRLFREHCHSTSDGMFVKDLRVINRSLNQLVLVDNAAYSYAFQVENGIPILPYYEGRNDYELSSLEKYLEGMILAKDVREINKKTFKLDQYRNYDDPDQLVKELYSGGK